MKQCPKCKRTISSDGFYLNKKTKSGLQSWCKECSRIASKWYHKENPQKAKIYSHRSRRKRTSDCYQFTVKEYEVLLQRSNGVCEICGSPETIKSRTGTLRPLSIDHCHKTGKIRGLLCHRCNVAIGLFKEDLDIMASAASYLINNGI